MIRRSSSFNTGRIDHIYDKHRNDKHLLEPTWDTLYADRVNNATTPRFFLHCTFCKNSINVSFSVKLFQSTLCLVDDHRW
jgi:hypothetical protein